MQVLPHQIFQKDYSEFLQGLDKKSVDLILTDPPYTISRKTGFSSVKKGVKRFSVNMEFGDWDVEQIDLDQLSKDMYGVLRDGGTAIVWYDLWKISHLSEAMIKAGFKMIRMVIWEKTNPVPLNMKSTYLSNCREVAVMGVKKGKPTFHGSYDNGIYSYPIPRHKGKRLHPTQKPLDLFREIVKKHSNPGDLVVDPFLGSGTTAIAALETGRQFQGCDISEQYANISKERVLEFIETSER
ncbi:site-specific DNA-methyltransferase [Aquimarina sp. MMG016]|uniref:DNA-methyltransferase n=1 Tax=Aquimarina sp. MMG016 TaxID=2822690 RepID=UPI001B39EA24|nr:site-specific DNA-methyltransferase [Aquimarina sp. MMG016]MBQ4818899.1 site-specific DNA-methyltransferase [Aquimarina sp. MMG016]